MVRLVQTFKKTPRAFPRRAPYSDGTTVSIAITSPNILTTGRIVAHSAGPPRKIWQVVSRPREAPIYVYPSKMPILVLKSAIRYKGGHVVTKYHVFSLI
jgi:hypothetical protein